MGDNGPRPGDIVVHRQIHSPAIYVLSRLDGVLQLSYKDYQEALASASRFASRAHLDVWYTTDDGVYEQVFNYRPAVELKS
jgi:hypothetical protein